jgi:hypothetical protein
MAAMPTLRSISMSMRWIAAALTLALSPAAWAFPTYAGGKGIWGADLLSEQERQEYVQRIQGMRSYQECVDYVAGHRKQIQERAAARNVVLPPPPATTPCEVMQRMGRFGSNPSSCPTQK